MIAKRIVGKEPLGWIQTINEMPNVENISSGESEFVDATQLNLTEDTIAEIQGKNKKTHGLIWMTTMKIKFF